MNNKKGQDVTGCSRPQKFVLHMVCHGGDWTGKVTSFADQAEFHFDSLKVLFEWLQSRAAVLPNGE